MHLDELQSELNRRVAKYDLLCHPYYRAWSEGQLTREDLRVYSEQYYHFVHAFPSFMSSAIANGASGSLLSALQSNLDDEQTGNYSGGVPHCELWLDFAEGMGARRDAIKGAACSGPVQDLIARFDNLCRTGSPLEAVAAMYAFEAQTPKVAQEKALGLKERYGADDKTCEYFRVHAEEDAQHSDQWLRAIADAGNVTGAMNSALDAAENAAKWLWESLDGLEIQRQARNQATVCSH